MNPLKLIFILMIIVNFSVWGKLNKSQNLEIYFLDVGQGDSTLVITPDDYTILIDGGPDNTVLSKLSEVLSSYEKRIDFMILTHPDRDHVGGLADVALNYDVEYAMYTDIIGKSYEFEMFNKEISNVKTIDYNQNGLKIGCCVYLNMLWPGGRSIDYLEPNDTSISFELVYKDFNIFFAGDLSKQYEEKILNIDDFLDVDILKVSHHGSKTSTSREFVQEIKPELAIIPVGKDNKFGHPHDQVLINLEKADVKYLLTSKEGTININSNGYEYW